jgi:hypothetical protein
VTGRKTFLPNFNVHLLHWGLLFRPLDVRRANYLEYNRIGGFKENDFVEGYALDMPFKEFSLKLNEFDYLCVAERLGLECHI